MRKILKAEWQRCKVHFYRNVFCQISKRSQPEVSEAMKAVFVQRDEKTRENESRGIGAHVPESFYESAGSF